MHLSKNIKMLKINYILKIENLESTIKYMFINSTKKNLKQIFSITATAGVFVFSQLTTSSTSAQIVPLNKSTSSNAKKFACAAINNPKWAGGALISIENNAKVGFKIEAQFNNDGVTGLCTFKYDHSFSEGIESTSQNNNMVATDVPFSLLYENDRTKENFNEVYFDIFVNKSSIRVGCGNINDLKMQICSNVLSLDQSGNSNFWLGPKFENIKKERDIIKLVSQIGRESSN